MSCNTCQTSFSFFTRENGCPSCGFSYCSKCLKYKYNLPNVGEKKICGRCFNKLQRMKTEEKISPSEDFSIPDGLDQPMAPIDITKKMESLENPSRPPITLYRRGSKLDRLKADLDPVDQEIVNRLKKLRNEDKQVPLPTEDEIRRRLALLKDQDPDIVRQPIDLNQVDTRTDQQKTEDLIKEYLERLEISKAAEQSDSDIQARLDSLRGVDSSKYPSGSMTGMDEEMDEATATKKIIEKALAEATLETKLDNDELENVETKESDQRDIDVDYDCCICGNTKNLVMCKGCTGDLFCPECFDLNHDDFELKKHKPVKFDPSMGYMNE